MYYEDQKLGLTEYTEHFYDNLSRLITNQAHIDSCKNFYEHIAFKTYEKYYSSKTENYSISQIKNLTEIFLDAMFRYKPAVNLPEDVIDIN